jgi:hypothetical protein
LKAHSSATQLKKGEKMAKKSRFLAKQPNRKQALMAKGGVRIGSKQDSNFKRACVKRLITSSSKSESMTRREAISHSAILLGGAISAPTLAAILQGCKAEPSKSAASTFLNADQEEMVTTMADIILPKTSTPGAVETGVPAFIYLILQDCYPDAERNAFAEGLNKLDEECKNTMGRRFLKLKPEQQVEFLKKTDAQARSSAGASQEMAVHLSCWRRLKELTVVGYFTSETGASEVLQYLPVPGRLEVCMDMPVEQRAWATG